MPRLESPDETDWAAVANSLIPVARGPGPTAASQLRDRLVALASEYSPKSARVDLKLLRRDAHAMLDPTTRRNQKSWKVLDHLHGTAIAAVRDQITGSDGGPGMHLDRSDAAAELVATIAEAAAVVVCGASGGGQECAGSSGGGRSRCGAGQPASIVYQSAASSKVNRSVRAHAGMPAFDASG